MYSKEPACGASQGRGRLYLIPALRETLQALKRGCHRIIRQRTFPLQPGQRGRTLDLSCPPNAHNRVLRSARKQTPPYWPQ